MLYLAFATLQFHDHCCSLEIIIDIEESYCCSLNLHHSVYLLTARMAQDSRALQVLLLFIMQLLHFTAHVSGVTISTLPSPFFTSGPGVKIAQNSVIQLFCTADSSTAIITWGHNGTDLSNNPPHIRIGSTATSTSTTSVLTIDKFEGTDTGVYQCSVGGGMTTASTQLLTAFMPETDDDILFMFREPNNRETIRDSNLPIDNRTAVALGETIDTDHIVNNIKNSILLRCVAAHFNDAGQEHGSLVWIKDGQQLNTSDRLTITSLYYGTRYGAEIQITNFTESDAGIYQCIATDNSSSDSDVVTSIPFQLDTGEVLRLERVSPEVIPLAPPNKLVIEVKASGRYREITWTKDGMPFSNENRTGMFLVDSPKEFPNFAETFVRGVTNMSDLGIYTVALTAFNDTQTIEPVNLQFMVLELSISSTTVDDNTTVSVFEGASLNISCTSYGIPTPSIHWEFGGMEARFEQSDTAVEFIGSYPVRITSRLQIVSAQASDMGVYTCTGSSSIGAVQVGNSSDFITVEVLFGVLRAYFQLRLRPVGDCVTWTAIDRSGKFAAITDKLVSVVRESCFCSFDSANIVATIFSCITAIDDVVLRAELMYADTVPADELVEIISQWVSESPLIEYDGTLLSVDPTCPTELEFLFAEECVVFTEHTSTIIITTSVGGVVLIILTLLVVLAVAFCVVRNRSSFKLKTSSQATPTPMLQFSKNSAYEDHQLPTVSNKTTTELDPPQEIADSDDEKTYVNFPVVDTEEDYEFLPVLSQHTEEDTDYI